MNAVQPTSGLTGYTYSWNFGSWSGIANGATATVIPDGVSAGNISVIATACGVNAGSTAIAIPLEIIEPSTTASGDSHLCSGESSPFSLSPSLQSCATTSWSVSPSNATSSSSGSGTTANLSPGTGFNGSATITFTINTPCGSVTRTKSFFVGKPIITAMNLPVCFNKYTHYNISVSSSGGTSYRWGVPSCNIPSNQPGWWDPSCWHISTVMPSPAPQANIYVGEKTGSISVFVTNECGTVSMSKPIIWCNPQLPGGGPKYPFGGGGDDEGGGTKNRSSKNEFVGEIFNLYPNPTSDLIMLEFKKYDSQKINNKQIQIISANGTIISDETTATLLYQKDVSFLPSGTYFVKVISEGEVYNASFVKTE